MGSDKTQNLGILLLWLNNKSSHLRFVIKYYVKKNETVSYKYIITQLLTLN